ncbi:MAG: rhodanese-like domain-containing protein [Bauldia litoralis]
MRKISVPDLRAALTDGGELALVDVREEGVFLQGHLFWAACLPLSTLELRAPDLVPRRSARIVLCDGGSEDLADRSAAKLGEMGYTDVALLDGGTAAWAAAGGELFSGVNVPSKAFGEFVEHAYDTPRIAADELKRRIDAGEDIVILDSWPWPEYHRMNIPGGIDVPGAELVYRVHDLAPDPETTVVVNCAGRTRSIIGAQSLINASLPNTVMALKDGTMGWELAGFDCETGAGRVGPPPSPEGLEKARARAAQAAERFGVRFADPATIEGWAGDAERTLFVMDVRTPEEFEAGHLPGSRNAPGGQLVQSTDEYMATRNARVILVDSERVRAVMTASWLIQLGWPEVYVYAGDLGAAALETGVPVAPVPGLTEAPTIAAAALANRLSEDGLAVLDLATSIQYRGKHVPGAWWGVRARLAEAREAIGDAKTLVLSAPDDRLAHLAAPEAAALWPGAEVLVLAGGTRAWDAAGQSVEQGVTRPTTETDDIWYKPYDHDGDQEKHMNAYLSWETALVEQIARDGTVAFRKFG